MKVLVFEPVKSGHHLIFLRYVIDDLLSAGHAVTLAAEKSPAPSEALSQALGPLLKNCAWLPLRTNAGRFLHGKRLNAVSVAQDAAQADVVFLNCLDELSSDLFRRSALGVSAPKNLSGRLTGIFVRPRVADARLHPRFSEAWKARGFLRLVKRTWFRRLFILDETLPENLRAGIPPELMPVLPDPWEGDFTTEKLAARRALGLPADKYLFLHYGTQSRRKGLGTVVGATERLPAGAGFALVAAGRFAKEDSPEQQTLKQLCAEGRAYSYNRYITTAEEPLFFSACDAVVLAYEGHYGSSNVQGRAAAAGRPVISSDEGLVAQRTRSRQLGLTFPTRDADGLAKALISLRQNPSVRSPASLAAYAAEHSRENFRRVLLAGL